ncbi:MAG: signal peptidase II [Candidatus Omnitrophota bacterium]
MKQIIRSHFDVIIALLTVAVVIFLDRVTKSFFSEILSLGESLPVIRHVLHMTLVHNTGIAFGLFKDQGIVFIIIPVIAVGLLVYNVYFYRNFEDKISESYIIGFSMILGGAIGNLADRIIFGYVIDFIDFRIWPVFNVADSAITIGAVIIAIKCLLLTKPSQ